MAWSGKALIHLLFFPPPCFDAPLPLNFRFFPPDAVDWPPPLNALMLPKLVISSPRVPAQLFNINVSKCMNAEC